MRAQNTEQLHTHTQGFDTNIHTATSGQTGRQEGSLSVLGSDQFTVYLLPITHHTHTSTRTQEHTPLLCPTTASVSLCVCVSICMCV